MSVGAVLAHEYYGHRTFREEYLSDIENDTVTTPRWQDECRASITAAKIAPNLTERDRSNLIMDAVYRAHEYGQVIQMDDFMKEVVYGYSREERNITGEITPIRYVSEASIYGTETKQGDERDLSEMRKSSKPFCDLEF